MGKDSGSLDGQPVHGTSGCTEVLSAPRPTSRARIGAGSGLAWAAVCSCRSSSDNVARGRKAA
jgi:hypothetical protein